MVAGAPKIVYHVPRPCSKHFANLNLDTVYLYFTGEQIATERLSDFAQGCGSSTWESGLNSGSVVHMTHTLSPVTWQAET